MVFHLGGDGSSKSFNDYASKAQDVFENKEQPKSKKRLKEDDQKIKRVGKQHINSSEEASSQIREPIKKKIKKERSTSLSQSVPRQVLTAFQEQGDKDSLIDKILHQTSDLTLSELNEVVTELIEKKSSKLSEDLFLSCKQKIVEQGINNVQRLCNNFELDKGLELCEKLLQLDEKNLFIHRQYMLVLITMCQPHRVVSHAKGILADISLNLSAEERLSILLPTIDYATVNGLLEDAKDLIEKYEEEFPDHMKDRVSARKAILDRMLGSQEEFFGGLEEVNELHLPKKLENYLMLLLSGVQLTTEQLEECQIFVLGLFNNKKFNDHVQKILKSFEQTAFTKQSDPELFYRNPFVRSSQGLSNKHGDSSISNSSNEQIFEANRLNYLSPLISVFSTLAYKTQPEQLNRMLKAMQKLHSVLEKTENRKDFLAFEKILSALSSDEVFNAIKSEQDREDLLSSRSRFLEKKNDFQLSSITISNDEKLTGRELMAIHSLINLGSNLKMFIERGLISPTMGQALQIISLAEAAEKDAEKLLHILAKDYESGDLTFRRPSKFKELTGKDQGLLMNTYSKFISDFGHGAMIDQSLDLHEIKFSHVLDKYTYNNVDLQEFFNQDVYRLNMQKLVSAQGMNWISNYLNKLKQEGEVSPLLTLDQFVQEVFSSHFEEISSGDDLPNSFEYPEETVRKRDAVYREAVFGSIRNNGLLQLSSMRSPFHKPLRSYLPSFLGGKSYEGLDFKGIEFEGQMICTQFQALVVLKSLAMSFESLKNMMAEEIMREKSCSLEEALKIVDEAKVFTYPIDSDEDFTKMHPKRITELLKFCLNPVEMNPIAKEILQLPDSFYNTALFPKSK